MKAVVKCQIARWQIIRCNEINPKVKFIKNITGYNIYFLKPNRFVLPMLVRLFIWSSVKNL
jgi:hypothetical protein